MSAHAYWEIVKEAASRWLADNAPRLGAALAFYSMLSLAPLLVITMVIAGSVFGEEAARGQMVAEIEGLVGTEEARAIQAMLANADEPAVGTLAGVIGVVILLFGATGVFGELQSALNNIWGVQARPGRGLWAAVSDRFMSFAMVLGTGFLLLVSLVLSAALSAFSGLLTHSIPGLAVLGLGLNLILSFAVFTVLFVLILKYVPDVRVAWSDVWFGAVLTSVLFSVGKLLLGIYLGRGAIGSAYGAAGSLVVLLIWIYYSAQILYFGAEVTLAHAQRTGAKVEPTRNSMFVKDVLQVPATPQPARELSASVGGGRS